MTDGRSKSLVAYHEVGHAICGTLTPGHDPVQKVTNIAKQMVTVFGMSDIGPWSLQDAGAQSGDMIMRMMARNSASEELLKDIDANVMRISEEAYEVALKQMRDNREAIDKIVELLLEKETISGKEFRGILSQYTTIPEENRLAAEAQERLQAASKAGVPTPA